MLERHVKPLTTKSALADEWNRLRTMRGANWPQRVAIVHYWLVGMRGGERVLERLLTLFPDATIFTHVYNPDAVSSSIRERRIETTFVNKIPGARRYYQRLLPLMPMALEQLDLTGYDLVISSESGPAKGVITNPDTIHLCYVHSPMRYLWDGYHQYRATAGPLTRAAMPWVFHRLRMWDYASAARPDQLLANSQFVKRRIAKAWNRDARVVYPPVSLDDFTPSDEIDDHYLWVGQMAPYKRPEVAVDAFNRLGLPLLMIGDGPLAGRIRAQAGDNVRVVSKLSFADLKRAYSRCRALVFTAEEDFGLIPVEVVASGRPVLAFGGGGALETISEGVSGLFFDNQTADALIDGVERMERWLKDFRPGQAIASVDRFAPHNFDVGIMQALSSQMR